jgi:hypothetical protein
VGVSWACEWRRLRVLGVLRGVDPIEALDAGPNRLCDAGFVLRRTVYSARMSGCPANERWSAVTGST